jgi:stalled ribosome alternative rescue factor ArfA
MDLVPLVSNADNKIIFLMSNVNNNRSGPGSYLRVLKHVSSLRWSSVGLHAESNESSGLLQKG